MFNSFGHIYRFFSWGESHGKAIGCTIDGVPPNIPIDNNFIQKYVDKRRPGFSLGLSTTRREDDKIEVLSGVFLGKTTGAPISIIVKNENHRSSDYTEIKNIYRPAHADFLYKQKYINNDYRGGGRSSGRETLSRVIAGAVARKIIPETIKIQGAVTGIGIKNIKNKKIDWDFAENNELFCPDKTSLEDWKKYLQMIINDNDSIGASCEIRVTNVPIGIGEPVYKKLEAYLAEAIMGINAVKSFEIGIGKESATMKGSEFIDELYSENKNITYSSNNSGGIIGGISNGMPIVIKFSVKPPSSINRPINTINSDFQNTVLYTTGRHDACIGIRIIPVAQAMVACVLADLFLMSKTRALF